MKSRLILTYIILSISTFYSFSQNLIPNPSFEYRRIELDHCSETTCRNNLECAEMWINPTNDTPDYFNINHTECPTAPDVTAPQNWLGYQYPKDGDGYIGIHTYTTDFKAHEYAMCELNEPLFIGQTYDFTMYVSKADNTFLQTNGLGIYLSVSDDFHNSFCCEIYVEPQYYVVEVLNDSSDDWQEITFTIIADQNYDHLTIGRFFERTDPRFIIEGDVDNADATRASYYIDDVSLIPRPVPELDLGDDIITCSEILLESPLKASSYLWSTGSTDSTLLITSSGEYWLEVNRFGEIRRDTIQVDFINEDNNISPNPASGIVKYEMTSNEQYSNHWKLYDISGKQVLSGVNEVIIGSHEYALNLSRVGSGIYILEYTNSCRDKKIEKIVIQK